MTSRLPYFDCILERLGAGDPVVTSAFGRHVHWGYWDEPARADGSVSDYEQAAERLCRRVLDVAGVRDGHGVLDAGCGFGGALGELSRRHSGLDLVGLNVDARQLGVARSWLEPRGNRITLVAGDACRLPFSEKAFDVVTCLEAVFHFASRQRFFREARRVLRPGGVLVLCDFVPRFVIPWLWDYFDRRFRPILHRLYGPSDMRCTLGDYRRIAAGAGLRLSVNRDVTRQTYPSCRVLRSLVRRIAPDPDGAEEVIRRVEFATRIGLLRYRILAFRSPRW